MKGFKNYSIIEGVIHFVCKTFCGALSDGVLQRQWIIDRWEKVGTLTFQLGEKVRKITASSIDERRAQWTRYHGKDDN